MIRVLPLATATLSAAVMLMGSLTLAQGSDPATAATQVRQAHMQLYAFNLGTIGAMAQERVAYDSAAATAAAANLVALAGIDQQNYWIAGSDSESLEVSAALPAAFANVDDMIAKNDALGAAAAAMQVAAAGGLDQLKAAMGPLGATCSACHELYRQRQ